MTDTKQPTEEQFEEALNAAVGYTDLVYLMLKEDEGTVSVGVLRYLFQAGHALAVALAEDPWKSVHEELPAEGGFVLCHFAGTGDQIVCYYNPPALVRGPTFMHGGDELVPDYWKPLDTPTPKPTEENCNADLH